MDKVFDVNEFALTVTKNKTIAVNLFNEFGLYVNHEVDNVKKMTVQDVERFLSNKLIASQSGYNAFKSGIDSIMNWFYAQQVLTKRQSYDLTRVDWEGLMITTVEGTFFKDLDEAFNYLDDLFCLAGLENDAVLVFKAVYTLFYHIDICDKNVITNMKKEDCLKDIQSVRVNDKLYYLGKYYKFVEDYRNATSSRTIKNTKVVYMESDYLFRTSVSQKIEFKTLTQMENKINTLVKEMSFGRLFRFQAIRKLGLFVRINDKMIKGADFVSATSELTKQKRNSIKTVFMLWKKFYNV